MAPIESDVSLLVEEGSTKAKKVPEKQGPVRAVQNLWEKVRARNRQVFVRSPLSCEDEENTVTSIEEPVPFSPEPRQTPRATLVDSAGTSGNRENRPLQEFRNRIVDRKQELGEQVTQVTQHLSSITNNIRQVATNIIPKKKAQPTFRRAALLEDAVSAKRSKPMGAPPPPHLSEEEDSSDYESEGECSVMVPSSSSSAVGDQECEQQEEARCCEADLGEAKQQNEGCKADIEELGCSEAALEEADQHCERKEATIEERAVAKSEELISVIHQEEPTTTHDLVEATPTDLHTQVETEDEDPTQAPAIEPVPAQACEDRGATAVESSPDIVEPAYRWAVPLKPVSQVEKQPACPPQVAPTKTSCGPWSADAHAQMQAKMLARRQKMQGTV